MSRNRGDAINAPKGAPSGLSYQAQDIIRKTREARAMITKRIAGVDLGSGPGVVLGKPRRPRAGLKTKGR